MTLLFKSEPLMVFVPSPPLEKSRPIGAHEVLNSSFLYFRITQMLGQAQSDLLIVRIKFIY